MTDQFLDHLCQNCSEEDHDTCWDLKPDPDCVCCTDTAGLLQMITEAVNNG